MGATILGVIYLIALFFDFIGACILTWAICFICSLFGITLAFSWKLVIAIWIIASLLTTRVKVQK